ncbi:hypothetical protein PG989_002123 [Apiospora arundinis]
MGERFALLVGIDHYPKGDRPARDGHCIELSSLRGCVNDVLIISNVLHGYGIQNQTLLTSAALQPSTANPTISHEGYCLPTYANIISNIKAILEQAKYGDLFFFHFSGHGASLTSIKGKSPGNREVDPSLIPMDFCLAEPALRGWELNNLLREFHEKNVHVVVSLDSCFSEGAWRHDDAIRTPIDWEPPPNLPIDEAVDESRCSSDYRRVNGERVWGIDPDNFVVMTACMANQGAKEEDRNGKRYGVFTYELSHYLESRQRDNLPRPTYGSICDYVNSRIPSSQTPQVFGGVRLIFLETTVVFVPASFQVNIRDVEASLTIGKAHGVKEGAVFINRLAQSEVTLVIDEVSDFNSKGTLHGDLGETVPEFVPYKWYSEEMIRIFVDPDLGLEFQTALEELLQQRIASTFTVQKVAFAVGVDDGIIQFQVQNLANNRVEVSASPIPRCPELSHHFDMGEIDSEDTSVVKAAADTIAHLLRFAQVCSLRSETSNNRPMFEVKPNFDTDTKASLTEGCELTCVFENNDHEALYYTVLSLAPEYHIEQTTTNGSRSQKVLPCETGKYVFSIELSEKVRDTWAHPERLYHDIMRFAVTRERPLSLEYLELPEIWNAGRATTDAYTDTSRRVNGEYGHTAPDIAWWTVDFDLYTK